MQEVMNILIRAELSLNQFGILWYISENMAAPDILVPAKTAQIRHLKSKGFLNEESQLTDKSKDLTKEIQGFFKKQKKKTDSIVMGNNYNDNLTIYNEIFPKERLQSGMNARSAEINVKPNMRWFFDNTNFTWEEVFTATKAYNVAQELAGKKFMTCSQYFVRKQMKDKSFISLLADWCQSTKDGIDGPMEDPFRETVFK